LHECFESVLKQTYCGPIEVSIFEDLSQVRPLASKKIFFVVIYLLFCCLQLQDGSYGIIEEWVEKFEEKKDMTSIVSRNDPTNFKGQFGSSPPPK